MSTPNSKDASSAVEAFVRVLTTTNAVLPAAVPGIALILDLFKSGIKAGKSLEEIEAEATDSMNTALRTRAKSTEQMGDQP